MKILICILLWLNCSGQTDSPFVATWHTKSEVGVNSYEVQQSTNKINWNILATVLPKNKDSNNYAYVLPRVPVYYRIASKMIENSYFFTDTVKLDTSFNIHNVESPKRTLYFTSDNEPKDLSYYSIQQSYYLTSGFIEKQQLKAKGNSDYKSNRFANKYKYYRVTAVFKNGSKQILTTRLISK